MPHFSPKKTSVITQLYNATHRFKAPSSRGCKTTPKHKSNTSMFDCCEWSFPWIVNIFSPVNIVLVYYRKALIWSHLSTEHYPLSIFACSGVFWWTPVGLSCDSLSIVGHSWVSYYGAPLQVAKSCAFFLRSAWICFAVVWGPSSTIPTILFCNICSILQLQPLLGRIATVWWVLIGPFRHSEGTSMSLEMDLEPWDGPCLATIFFLTPWKFYLSFPTF